MTIDESGFGNVDTATIAFRRLLKNAALEDQARVDALVVLSQSTVFAALWPGSDSEIRTLTNSAGDIAMPLFTGYDVMSEVARLYGWLNPDGSLQHKEIGAREALRQAIARGVQYIVVDFGSHFAVEFAKQEIEPLLLINHERDTTGPFAGTGKVSSFLMEVVRQTPRSTNPPSKTDGYIRSISRPQPTHHSNSHLNKDVNIAAPAESLGSPTHQNSPTRTPLHSPNSDEKGASQHRNDPPPGSFSPQTTALSDSLLLQLSEKLRQFPEVEWACSASIQQDTATTPMVGVRIDPTFQTRWEEIKDSLVKIGQTHQIDLQVYSLNDPQLVRQAREVGIVFHPFRK